jgi:hypothetical protein
MLDAARRMYGGSDLEIDAAYEGLCIALAS